jgi:hypothetical protein
MEFLVFLWPLVLTAGAGALVYLFWRYVRAIEGKRSSFDRLPETISELQQRVSQLESIQSYNAEELHRIAEAQDFTERLLAHRPDAVERPSTVD